MTDNQLKEEFEQLSELIRKANALINPEDSLAYLLKKDIRDRLAGEKPKCFLKLLPIGRDTSPYLIPICNRAGIEDPKVIAVSLKLVQRLMDEPNGRFDINSLQSILNQLNHRNNVLLKTVPKPATAAARKAKVTRMFKNIKSYLDMNKTNAIGDR
jgi:hypothetical protein